MFGLNSGVLCIARNHTPFIYHPNTFDTCCVLYALQRRCACAIQSRKCVSIFIAECSFQRFAHCFLFVVMKYLLVLFTVWFTFLLAIDFFETPIRFSTKGLSIGQAVSIGRTLFHKLLWLEFIFLVLGLFNTWRLRLNTMLLILIVMGIILVFQKYYLLPILDLRVEKLMTNQQLISSWHHSLYVVLEVLKCSFLLGLIILNLKKL